VQEEEGRAAKTTERRISTACGVEEKRESVREHLESAIRTGRETSVSFPTDWKDREEKETPSLQERRWRDTHDCGDFEVPFRLVGQNTDSDGDESEPRNGGKAVDDHGLSDFAQKIGRRH
jgi:hypothetical protein